jgi:hypothetical protein
MLLVPAALRFLLGKLRFLLGQVHTVALQHQMTHALLPQVPHPQLLLLPVLLPARPVKPGQSRYPSQHRALLDDLQPGTSSVYHSGVGPCCCNVDLCGMTGKCMGIAHRLYADEGLLQRFSKGRVAEATLREERFCSKLWTRELPSKLSVGAKRPLWEALRV